MLLLVISVLQKSFQKIITADKLAQQEMIKDLLNETKDQFNIRGLSQAVSVDLPGNKITLKEYVFKRGSACITDNTKDVFKNLTGKIASLLKKDGRIRVVIEGHTDNVPVMNPVLDYAKFCTVYDDNFTLSAARAREARKLLTGELDAEIAKHFIVAGFGDSSPLISNNPGDDANRRVEVRFIVE